jgi:small subunit ribosomal protein S20
MANHKSAKKRIRQIEDTRVHNRYYSRSARNAVKELRNTTDKKAAAELYPKVASMLDKLAKKNIIQLNKAANLKSSLSKHVNSL